MKDENKESSGVLRIGCNGESFKQIEQWKFEQMYQLEHSMDTSRNFIGLPFSKWMKFT